MTYPETVQPTLATELQGVLTDLAVAIRERDFRQVQVDITGRAWKMANKNPDNADLRSMATLLEEIDHEPQLSCMEIAHVHGDKALEEMNR